GALIDRVGLERREDVFARELLPQVGDDDLVRARLRRLAGHGAHVVALADVGDEGDDRDLVLVLDPLEEHGRVEPAGVGQDDLLGHAMSFLWFRRPRIFLASFGAGVPSRTTTSRVSSPATVPTISGQPRRSSASPTGEASPGSVLTTRRFPEL